MDMMARLARLFRLRLFRLPVGTTGYASLIVLCSATFPPHIKPSYTTTTNIYHPFLNHRMLL